MREVFLVSDTHFGHKNICQFLGPDGVTPLRPWNHVDEMDAEMVERWNSVVRPSDVVYHLGDVVMNRKSLALISKLHGDKRLILGNHDVFNHADYLLYFNRLHGSHKIDDLLLTHIPVHIDSIAHWAQCNVHGHIHAQDIEHSSYFNVSVERINYMPIALDDLRLQISQKKARLAH